MIELLSVLKRPHHHVRLNNHFRADVGWWKVFVEGWNGVQIFPPCETPTVVVTSDASGYWGCGAWCQTSWFQYQWPERTDRHHIAFKELFAALLAAAAWGPQWKGIRVLWRCDNQAAVQAVSSRSCRDRSLMHLLRCLFFLEAYYQFELVASYLPGEANTLADDLSRDRRSAFLLKAPDKQKEPSQFPQQLPELLLEEVDWTSRRWTRIFTASLTAA